LSQQFAGVTDGAEPKVEFFVNGNFNGATSLGVDSTSPYSAPVNNLAAGNYTLPAVATDNLGAKATNSVSLVVNSPPTASLSSPGNGASFVAPGRPLLRGSIKGSSGWQSLTTNNW